VGPDASALRLGDWGPSAAHVPICVVEGLVGLGIDVRVSRGGPSRKHRHWSVQDRHARFRTTPVEHPCTAAGSGRNPFKGRLLARFSPTSSAIKTDLKATGAASFLGG
jgi:hypothetical protein